MGRASIRYDDYKVKAFLDANIILECRPITELPWQEVDPTGPILALITPTAMTEVDSKKHDGRLGKRAREFNRLIAQPAAGGAPVVVRESSPRVELAMSSTSKIPWEQYDDLDPEDGDSRIVAEILHAKGMGDAGKIIVSHDIKPIAFASNYGVSTLHVSDSWLRQPEPHPRDKELQKLNQKLSQYQASEPSLEVGIDFAEAEAAKLIRIQDLSDVERESILRRIRIQNPPKVQDGSIHGISGLGYVDYSYDGRFKKYRERLPDFMEKYEGLLERVFNQTRFRLKLTNVGSVQAENLLLEVSVADGWIHNRLVFVAPSGPAPPSPRSLPHFTPPNVEGLISRRVGRHEVEYKERPRAGTTFSVTCADFRHGQEYVFDGIVTPDVRADQPLRVCVSVTASNLHGALSFEKSMERTCITHHVSELIDMTSLKISPTVPIKAVFERARIEDIDWKILQGRDESD